MTASLLIAGILQNVAAVRPLYLALWCGIAILSGALVYLMRSRWGRSSPLYRCAVGSLLVHLVLVGLTMTVRLVVGDGGAGTGPPIYVKLVDDVQREGPITLAAPLLVVEEAAKQDSDLALAKPASDAEAEPAEVRRRWSRRRCLSRRSRWRKRRLCIDEAAGGAGRSKEVAGRRPRRRSR